MKRIATGMLALAGILAASAWGAEAPTSKRRVKVKVEPTYPQLARERHVVGTVRLEVEIAANGSVKNVRPLGGHPLLIQCSKEAVSKWRYEPGTEMTVVIEFDFK